jgi:hypothetical protein
MGRHFLGIKEEDEELAKILSTSKQNVYRIVKKLVEGKILMSMKIETWKHIRRLLLIRLDTNLEKLYENFTNSESEICMSMIQNRQIQIFGTPTKSKKDRQLGELYDFDTNEPNYTYEVSIKHKESSIKHKDTRTPSTSTHTPSTSTHTHNSTSTVYRRAKQDSCQKPKGYYASEYAPGGNRADSIPKNDKSAFVHYYMRKVFTRRDIDYFIPMSKMGMFYRRVKDILGLVGGLEEAKRYIDWYLGRDDLQASGWNLNLLVSSAMVNHFLGGDPQETKKGLGTSMALTEEERKEMLKKARIL